jgi:hypothetical protein
MSEQYPKSLLKILTNLNLAILNLDNLQYVKESISLSNAIFEKKDM